MEGRVAERMLKARGDDVAFVEDCARGRLERASKRSI